MAFGADCGVSTVLEELRVATTTRSPRAGRMWGDRLPAARLPHNLAAVSHRARRARVTQNSTLTAGWVENPKSEISNPKSTRARIKPTHRLLHLMKGRSIKNGDGHEASRNFSRTICVLDDGLENDGGRAWQRY